MFPAIMSPELTPTPISSCGIPRSAQALLSSPQLADHVDRGLHRVLSMINVVERRTVQGHDHVADELVHRPLVAEHDVHHP